MIKSFYSISEASLNQLNLWSTNFKIKVFITNIILNSFPLYLPSIQCYPASPHKMINWVSAATASEARAIASNRASVFPPAGSNYLFQRSKRKRTGAPDAKVATRQKRIEEAYHAAREVASCIYAQARGTGETRTTSSSAHFGATYNYKSIRIDSILII